MITIDGKALTFTQAQVDRLTKMKAKGRLPIVRFGDDLKFSFNLNSWLEPEELEVKE